MRKLQRRAGLSYYTGKPDDCGCAVVPFRLTMWCQTKLGSANLGDHLELYEFVSNS